MAQYWLRVEAQNLASFILDTQDLSTTRGGSLTLLDVVQSVDALGRTKTETFEAVTTGASIGIWRFEAADCAKAHELAMAIEDALAGRGPYADAIPPPLQLPARHATVRAVIWPATKAPTGEEAAAFAADREALEAIARRRQLSSTRLIYPSPEPGDRGIKRKACEIDLLRPAARTMMLGGELAVSRSVADRREYGIDRKQGFYRDQLAQSDDATDETPDGAVIFDGGKPAKRDEAVLRGLAPLIGSDGHPFAYQLPSIAEDTLPAPLQLRGALKGKIAVLYMDGNGFGAIQRKAIAAGRSPLKVQQAFDRRLRANRRALLADILHEIAAGPEGLRAFGPPSVGEAKFREEQGRNAKVIRFETLLWGGDEMMFAMPARFGWEIAARVAAETASWSVTINGTMHPLTHAIGLVFCHDDAPISRVQQLARALADHAKEMTLAHFADPHVTEAAGRRETFIVPLVLESFDHVGNDLDDYLARRAPHAQRGAVMDDPLQTARRGRFFALSVAELEGLRRLAARAAASEEPLSRRKLRLMARAVHMGLERGRFSPDHLATNPSGHWFARAWSAADDPLASGPAADLALLGKRRAATLLEDNWDYLTPIVAETRA